MQEIYFPAIYKKNLLDKTKNTTIRVKDEVGKYLEGKTYLATSYAGRNWDIKIKITNIKQICFKELSDFQIPRTTVNSIKRKENISKNSKIEIIKFIIL